MRSGADAVSKLIGIDYGDRRFGLAISDATRFLARPLEVVEGEPAVLARLEELTREEDIGAFVLGIPHNMDGSVGRKARQVLGFRDRLIARLGLPVETWDERLTSVQAEGLLREQGFRKAAMRRNVDRVAAQILLQSYLDAHGRAPEGAPEH